MVKVLATNSVNLSLIPGTHMVKRQNDSHKLSPTSRALQPITNLSLKTRRDCKAGQEPVTEEVKCPWEEPTTVTLLNGHSMELPNKYFPLYHSTVLSSYCSRRHLTQRLTTRCDCGIISPNVTSVSAPLLPGLRNTTEKKAQRF